MTHWLINFWENFLSYRVSYIFAVSTETKKELVENVKVNPFKTDVVYHAFDDTIYKPIKHDIGLSFIYVGRLEKQKGIIEVLKYFSKRTNITLSIVGSGVLENTVNEYTSKYKNIQYLGFVKDQSKLAEIYANHDFLLLNSKRTENWEELFGMVIIEAMACGVIPITTDHKGPLEIISNEKDGFIFTEDKYIFELENIIIKFKYDKISFSTIKENAIQRAKDFSVNEISKKWESIFE